MKISFIKISAIFFLTFFVLSRSGYSQAMDEMWDSGSKSNENPNLKWFKEAKFGLFIHWGLYSQLAGTWKGKNYYGSGEWIMNRAKIPVKEYAKVASDFDPVNFNADEWAQLAKDAGIKYIVITAKHHEGFAMYDSKVSDFNIVKATPFKKDPMKALALATAKRGIHFGFYYSQFQDWHEPNGGRNSWDFDESKKDYKKYYREKAIPQLKELLTNYGPLGIVWFDTPGGLTKQETQNLVDSLHRLQPNSLFSSRVGLGLGDYKDFGDSEVPPVPIKGAWESIYTHNDSWGYIRHDMNFKTPKVIIQLLANVASKGGNLMLNVGPDGYGNIPKYSIQFLKETGKWLQKNGESIYGTTYGLIPEQPWGISTSKPGKQFLHIFCRPHNGKLWIPDFMGKVSKVYSLSGKQSLKWKKSGNDVIIDLPPFDETITDKVFVIQYSGKIADYNLDVPITVSDQFNENKVGAIFAKTHGSAEIKSLTYSHYYGDWKHATCVIKMLDSSDKISFNIRVLEQGIYQLALEYSCPPESAGQEGSMEINGEVFLFRTLGTSEYDKKAPLQFIKHTIATTTFSKPGNYTIEIKPLQNGKDLFKLKSIIVSPVQ
jgi:alpha-L-fucosidase